MWTDLCLVADLGTPAEAHEALVIDACGGEIGGGGNNLGAHLVIVAGGVNPGHQRVGLLGGEVGLEPRLA